jgi:hypothetical protein
MKESFKNRLVSYQSQGVSWNNDLAGVVNYNNQDIIYHIIHSVMMCFSCIS